MTPKDYARLILLVVLISVVCTIVKADMLIIPLVLLSIFGYIFLKRITK